MISKLDIPFDDPMAWWQYDNLVSGHPYDWSPAGRGDHPWDQLDFHLDLGCGRVPKARMGIDLRPSPGATALAIDLNMLQPSERKRRYTGPQKEIIDATEDHYQEWRLWYEEEWGDIPMTGLPFPTDSIKSIVTHHCLEHIGDGFEMLMEECYRILEPDGIMRIIVPLFPSYAAVGEYDHKRVFVQDTFAGFCAVPDGPAHTDGFSEPYNSCAFKQIDLDFTGPTPKAQQWTPADARELRVTLWKHRGGEPCDPTPPSL